MRARTAVQITLSPKDHRRAARLARELNTPISTFLRLAALEEMARLESERDEKAAVPEALR